MSGSASGAMSGAATGAVIGSAVPVIGTVIGAVVGGVAGWFSGGGDDNSAATEIAMQELAFQSAQYDRSLLNAMTQGDLASGYFDQAKFSASQAVNQVSAASATGYMASATFAKAYLATSYDAKAFKATAYETQTQSFLGAIREAQESGAMSMEAFNRRYGNIMDNMERSIIEVSRERLAASGREQLMIDTGTLKANFRQEIAKAGLTRSGTSVAMEQRMAMETQKQARSIDVNSYGQALQLQSQGINSLTQMTGIRENIAARQENISQNKAHGLLSAAMQDSNLQTQVSMQYAQNKTNVSQQNAAQKTQVSLQNAANKTNVSITNATNATNVSLQNAATATNVSMFNAGASNSANMFNASALNARTDQITQMDFNRWYAAESSKNTFYNGIATPSSTNLINATNAQTAANTAGWNAAGQAAGYAYKSTTQTRGGITPVYDNYANPGMYF